MKNPGGFHILFAGLSGIPETPAAPIQRIIQMGKALAAENRKVTYLNRLPGSHRTSIMADFFPGLDTVKIEDSLPAKNSYSNRYGRLAWKVLAFPAEFFKLISIHRKEKIDILFIYTSWFGLVLFYVLTAKILGSRTVLSYVEFRSGIASRSGFFMKINDRLFDRYAPCLVNGVNPISHRIEDHVEAVCPGKRQIRIPALCDFTPFDRLAVHNDTGLNYFLFCGSAGYFDLIRKTIQAFLSICDRKGCCLQLVISGDPRLLEPVRKEIEAHSEIRMVSGIPYDDLVSLYSGAMALVIPLRDIPQDNYRFPHKISEYTASRRPIITTNVGEIPWYFTDKENAIICRDTSGEALTEAMEWALNHRKELDAIGMNGYRTGMENFSLTCYRKTLDTFLLDCLIIGQ